MDWTSHLPLIAILRGISPEETSAHVGALVDAGFDAIEIPLNSPDWPQSIAIAVREFGERALIGAGTVLREDDVDRLAALGARLIVTPNTRPALIRHAVARGLYVCAGFATASEAFEALDAGAHALKLFPASTHGPGHIRAIKATLPPTPVFAVGGITSTNLADYMAAGCVGAGLGSDLYEAGQPIDRTREMAQRFINAYHQASIVHDRDRLGH
ncbi:2-dehydro-3-deoxy-6-phosphogalactonate aldolase [Hydrocarboniphaga sp.]|uniref:2-dehydro-3-deoxy-6-phosphogalactonate aldolase n=1 Tax=Hydrocarboniphaga sp. TaxID=2033016 RepID=UPI003D0C8E44